MQARGDHEFDRLLEGDRSSDALSEKIAMAMNGSVTPASMVGLPGISMIELRVAAGTTVTW
jgi:hypothetical protein